ncbi:hypothetical protein [Desulfobacter curvatus]|uniref:hypothetical protein n=1 Tax=Desulfobacter curvatus TaxID=2290 RepID=UPI00036C39FE|nr:hypothetical protein [Desulfobacter curvatus]
MGTVLQTIISKLKEIERQHQQDEDQPVAVIITPVDCRKNPEPVGPVVRFSSDGATVDRLPGEDLEGFMDRAIKEAELNLPAGAVPVLIGTTKEETWPQ